MPSACNQNALRILFLMLSYLPFSPAIATNDCAILSTGAASDLALDDPERFEYLTRACGSVPPASPGASRGTRRSTPPSPVVHNSGEKAPNSAGTAKRNALKRVSDAPVQERAEGGCDYLFHPVKSLKHPVGTEACVGGHNRICRKNAKGILDWDEGGSACVTAPDALRVQELNTRDIHRTKEQVDESFKE